MHNLFLVYFINLYMFRAYLVPSSGGTTVCIQQLVLIIHFCLLSNQDNKQSSKKNNWYLLFFPVCCPTRTTDSHLKRIISTNCCIHTVVPPDDGPRYTQNMQRLTKYTKNKLCIKLVFLYTTMYESFFSCQWQYSFIFCSLCPSQCNLLTLTGQTLCNVCIME